MTEPETLSQARGILKKTSIQPWQTLTTGVITCTLLGAIALMICVITNSVEFSIVNLIAFLIGSFFIFGATGCRTVERTEYAVLTFFGKRILRDEFEKGKLSILSEGLHWVFPFMGISAHKLTLRPLERKGIVVTCVDSSTQTSFEVRIESINVTIFPWHPFRIEEVDGGMQKIEANVLDNAVEAIRDEAAGGTQSTGPQANQTTSGLISNSLRMFSQNTNDAVKKRLIPNNESQEWQELSNFGVLAIAIQLGAITIESEKLKSALEKVEIERAEKLAETSQATTLKKIADELQTLPPDLRHAAMVVAGLAKKDQKIIIERTNSVNTTSASDTNTNVDSIVDAVVEATLVAQALKDDQQP